MALLPSDSRRNLKKSQDKVSVIRSNVSMTPPLNFVPQAQHPTVKL